MFYQIPLSLQKINLEEQKLNSMISGLSDSFASLLNEFDAVISKTEQVFNMYQHLGSLYTLPYKDEISFSFRNLTDSLKLIRERVADSSSFFKCPLFEYIELHNEQVINLQQFIYKYQKLKKDIGKIQNNCNDLGINEDVFKLTCYLNYVMHNQFKVFYLLKNREIMTFLSSKLEDMNSNIELVF
jgi:hypothetical protein